MTTLRILVLDPRRSFSTKVRAALEWSPGRFELSASCTLPQELRSLLEGGLGYDLLLLDPLLPDFEQVSSQLLELAETFPAQTLVGLCEGETDRGAETAQRVLSFLRAGGRTLADFDEPPEALYQALKAAHAGEVRLPTWITALLCDWVLSPQTIPHRSHTEPLTERESQVLRLLSEGQTYAEVAISLSIGVGTVQSHVKNLYRKLKVSSKTEAARLAFQEGLLNSINS